MTASPPKSNRSSGENDIKSNRGVDREVITCLIVKGTIRALDHNTNGTLRLRESPLFKLRGHGVAIMHLQLLNSKKD
ncbi:hypothetical protein ACHAXS_006765 [Conticribra weissflogii]